MTKLERYPLCISVHQVARWPFSIQILETFCFFGRYLYYYYYYYCYYYYYNYCYYYYYYYCYYYYNYYYYLYCYYYYYYYWNVSCDMQSAIWTLPIQTSQVMYLYIIYGMPGSVHVKHLYTHFPNCLLLWYQCIKLLFFLHKKRIHQYLPCIQLIHDPTIIYDILSIKYSNEHRQLNITRFSEKKYNRVDATCGCVDITHSREDIKLWVQIYILHEWISIQSSGRFYTTGTYDYINESRK